MRTLEELADVVTAPRSKRDERKPWRFDSALLRAWRRQPIGAGHGLESRWGSCPCAFDPRRLRQAPLAHGEELLTLNQRVEGSSPSRRTAFPGSSDPTLATKPR